MCFERGHLICTTNLASPLQLISTTLTFKKRRTYMGNIVSSRASTVVASTSAKQAASRAPTSAAASSNGASGAVAAKQTAEMQPRIEGDDDWAGLMRAMSGAISSSSWDGSAPSPRGANERHPAARASSVSAKLPRVVELCNSEDGTSESRREKGQLTLAEVVAVFKLRRSDISKWDARALAARFGASDADMTALLQYTRTYGAHTDASGAVRGYYDAYAVPAVERFEEAEI